jgi:hypothetical protein
MAGWPAKGGTWAISRRSAHRLVIAHFIRRWRSATTPPVVVAAERLKVLRKTISQSLVNAGYFSQGPAAFERIILDTMGWY